MPDARRCGLRGLRARTLQFRRGDDRVVPNVNRRGEILGVVRIQLRAVDSLGWVGDDIVQLGAIRAVDDDFKIVVQCR